MTPGSTIRPRGRSGGRPALLHVPAGGAEAAVEDTSMPTSLLENTNELLSVLASTLDECTDVHPRLYNVHPPGESLPA